MCKKIEFESKKTMGTERKKSSTIFLFSFLFSMQEKSQKKNNNNRLWLYDPQVEIGTVKIISFLKGTLKINALVTVILVENSEDVSKENTLN